MNTPLLRLERRSLLALAIALIALAAGFRLLRATLLPELPNFAPLTALALCGALVLPGALALAIPLGALILTDGLLNLHFGEPFFAPSALVIYACYGLAVASGQTLRRLHAGLPAIFAAVVANSLLFYLATNTASWLGNPAYAKTAAGWLQALTVGLPGFPPTWTFFRASLFSDVLFTAGFLALLRVRTPDAQAAPAPLRR